MALILALLCSAPQILINLGVFTATDFEAEYGAFVAAGQLTAAAETGVWTANATWPGCTLGEGAPISWGKPGGNAELLGAPELSWTHVITDALSVVVFTLFLSRSQHLLLKRDTTIDVAAAYQASARIARAAALIQASTCAHGHVCVHGYVREHGYGYGHGDVHGYGYGYMHVRMHWHLYILDECICMGICMCMYTSASLGQPL